MKLLARFIDDFLLAAGCLCILYGLSMWSAVVTWIAGGAMLIGFGVLIGKVKAKQNAID